VFFQIQDVSFGKLGSMGPNSEITNVPGTECFLAEQSCPVAKKLDLKIL
jgi:hypothetical protein